MNSFRSLQHLIIELKPDDDNGGDDATGDRSDHVDNPHAETTAYEPRYTTIKVCDHRDSQVVSSNTLVSFNYAVETSGELESDTMEDTLPEATAAAIVESVADASCSGVRVTDPYTNETTTKHCFVSISAGEKDTLVATNCPTTNPNAVNCTLYSGTLQVVHTSACSQDDILEHTMDALDASAGEVYLVGRINNLMGDSPTRAVHVTVIDKNANDVPVAAAAAVSEVQPAAVSDDGLGGPAIAAIALMGLILLLFALLGLVWRRRVQSTQKMVDSDELKSCKTLWTVPSSENSSVPNSYSRDLMIQSSSMDVHRCASALCPVCRPDLGMVQAVRVPGRFELSNSTMQDLETAGSLETPPTTPSNWGRYRQPDQVSFVRVANPRRVTDWNNYDSKKAIREIEL
jgi:hypothetical protein